MVKNKINRYKKLLAAFVVLASNFVFLANFASAATLTNTYLRLNRMAQAQSTSMRLVFKTVGAGATSVAIDMNGSDSTTWTTTGSGAVNTTQTVSSASCAADTGATALPGSITAAGSGSTITISSVTALSATTSYCVDLTSSTAVTNPTAGEYHPTVTVGSDSTTIAVRTVGVGGDQVTVNATVPPSFNFAIGGCASNVDNFTANLASGSVGTTGGCTVTVNTNATTGWLAWASDSQTGLHSTAASKTIASSGTGSSSSTCSAGTECYRFGVTSITQGTGAGTTSAHANYDATGANHGSGLDGTLRLFASSTGTANGAVLTVKERAAISAITPAGNDYTDTITIVGAGNF